MPEADKTFQLITDRGDARLRLDRVLVRHLTTVARVSRTAAQRWIEEGAVTVDGRTTLRPSTRVSEGAAVGVQLPSSAVLKQRPRAEQHELSIVYEDAEVLVVNKPPGIVVHPSYRQTSGTLLNGLLWHLGSRADVRPGIVTRLDKDTSGLVLVALTAAAHAAFQRTAFRDAMRKEYLAIVRGWPRPGAGAIREPLGHDPRDRRRIVVTRDGMESETRYSTVSRGTRHGARESLLRCELVTGRTHQIRVHLAARGWPVVGDRVYGQPDTDITRQALHAWRLSFLAPSSRQCIDVEAPVPEDMKALLHSHGAELQELRPD
jgi:23S rRNA pseudouridine1911/1915/1917 synthase